MAEEFNKLFYASYMDINNEINDQSLSRNEIQLIYTKIAWVTYHDSAASFIVRLLEK